MSQNDERASDHISVKGVSVPTYLYGTAWKEDDTARLVRLALESGFRGIDTANQRRHYHEAAAGEALTGAIADGLLRREDVFLQTKFTYVTSQDHRLPYDPDADHATQVRQSFDSSLEHLQVEYVDSYVLHGPSSRRGLTPVDLAVWRTMEELHQAGKARFLGISNASAEQLEALCDHATVQPAFVQNRCYAQLGWDRVMRAACRQRRVVYQGFSLLTANQGLLVQPAFVDLVMRVKRTPAQVVFRFARQIGMVRLTGTTDPAHMQEDLACDDFDLSSDDLDLLERIAG
jgi:diketogulonate reductase-like aldo/keto reductase